MGKGKERAPSCERGTEKVKKRTITSVFLALSMLLYLGTGCGNLNSLISENATDTSSAEQSSKTLSEQEKEASEEEEFVDSYDKETVAEGNLTENKDIYDQDDDTSVITMYLTVSRGNDADGSDHTWQEINTYSAYDYADMGVDRYKVEGLLQIDETGNGVRRDSFGYGETVPNVSVQVRGQTSSRSTQKNYKIRIKDGKGSFRNQRTLCLNKHVGDPYRFINKMCYDMLKKIPQLIGGRTQFVHLYVKDNTVAGGDEYADYGLYTMVEQVNRTFLKNHGLDENGQLYKVTFFEWNKYEAVMMDPSDPEFDKAEFETYLEIKGNEDTSKLISVIDKIHNYTIPIDTIIEEHFDVENLCYWMAFNDLIGNYDVGARNLFIYSPLNSQKFYMICWDMDASFRYEYNNSREEYHEGESWEQGMTKYLGLTLINRMMKEKKYRDALSAAIEDLHREYVNSAVVNRMVSLYAPVVKPYYFSLPDEEHTRLEEWEYNGLIKRLGSEAESYYRIYYDTLKRPWPFFIGMPVLDTENNETLLIWDASYDVNGEDITYDLYLSTDYNLEEIIEERHDLRTPIASMELLSPGTYYLRVTATNESGYTQDCFDYVSVRGFGKAYGLLGFTINPDYTTEPVQRVVP